MNKIVFCVCIFALLIFSCQVEAGRFFRRSACADGSCSVQYEAQPVVNSTCVNGVCTKNVCNCTVCGCTNCDGNCMPTVVLPSKRWLPRIMLPK